MNENVGESLKVVQTNNRVKSGFILLLTTALLWSTGGIFVKLIECNPVVLAGQRSIIASLIILLIYGKKILVKYSLYQILGAFCYAGVSILFVTATKLTTAANAIFLQYTAPVYVILFGAWFLNEKVRLMDVISVVLALCGMGMFFNGKLEISGISGNLAALACGICYAWFTLFMRKQKDGSTLETLFLGNIITAIVSIPFMADSFPAARYLPAIAAMAVFQYIIPYILYSYAIKEVKAIHAVFITMLEPVLNPLWVFIIINERPGIWSIVGGATVIVSIALQPLLGLININKRVEIKNTVKKLTIDA